MEQPRQAPQLLQTWLAPLGALQGRCGADKCGNQADITFSAVTQPCAHPAGAAAPLEALHLGRNQQGMLATDLAAAV